MYILIVKCYVTSDTFYLLPLFIFVIGVNYSESKSYPCSRVRILFSQLVSVFEYHRTLSDISAAHVLFHLEKNQVKIDDKIVIILL